MTMSTLKKWALLAGVLAVGSVYWLGCDCGGEKDNPVTSSDKKPETWTPIPGTFTDIRDNTEYKTVKLNKTTWMAENLNYVPDNGTVTHVCYGNNVENCAKYGRLYRWTTAMAIDRIYDQSEWGGSDVEHQGICPAGWHLPSKSEWDDLFNMIGGISTAGKKLKSKEGWSDNGNGTDDYGFTALPSGEGCVDTECFGFIGEFATWWATTEDTNKDSRLAFRPSVGYDSDKAMVNSNPKILKYSVRCVQNN